MALKRSSNDSQSNDPTSNDDDDDDEEEGDDDDDDNDNDDESSNRNVPDSQKQDNFPLRSSLGSGKLDRPEQKSSASYASARPSTSGFSPSVNSVSFVAWSLNSAHPFLTSPIYILEEYPS